MDKKNDSNLAYCYCYGSELDIFNMKLDLDLFPGIFYGDRDKPYNENFMFFFDQGNRTLMLSLQAITARYQDIAIHLVDDQGKYEIHSKGRFHKVIRDMFPIEKYYKLIPREE